MAGFFSSVSRFCVVAMNRIRWRSSSRTQAPTEHSARTPGEGRAAGRCKGGSKDVTEWFSQGHSELELVAQLDGEEECR